MSRTAVHICSCCVGMFVWCVFSTGTWNATAVRQLSSIRCLLLLPLLSVVRVSHIIRSIWRTQHAAAALSTRTTHVWDVGGVYVRRCAVLSSAIICVGAPALCVCCCFCWDVKRAWATDTASTLVLVCIPGMLNFDAQSHPGEGTTGWGGPSFL